MAGSSSAHPHLLVDGAAGAGERLVAAGAQPALALQRALAGQPSQQRFTKLLHCGQALLCMLAQVLHQIVHLQRSWGTLAPALWL